MIATSAEPTRGRSSRSRSRLARRAVRATERRSPNLLDTLAEVYFQLGRSDDAVETIDQAIALAPGEAYFASSAGASSASARRTTAPSRPSELPPARSRRRRRSSPRPASGDARPIRV